MLIVADYKCSACGHTHEMYVEKRGDVFPLLNCTQCGKWGSFKKTFAPVAAVFKGEGFPTNDTKRK